MKKSVISFIAVMLIIVFLGVTAVTGVYIPGGWTMPFRDTAATETVTSGDAGDTDAADTADTADTTDTADTADTEGDAAADTETETAEESAELRAIIPSVLDTEHGIRLGLDLVGGSRIVYEAELPEGYDMGDLAGDMQTAQAMIRQRLTSQGFTEATVALTGDNRLTVEIPQITNPEEAVQTLGTTAQLLFMDMDGYNEYVTALTENPSLERHAAALCAGRVHQRGPAEVRGCDRGGRRAYGRL